MIKVMRKKIILAMTGLLCVCNFIGCGKTDPDEDRTLLTADISSVKEVTNFSAFEETEVPTEPVTEKQTEPVTEKQTEPVTEKQTEPPEEPYSKDYDFSDFKVLQAVFKGTGGIGSVPYTNRVEEDPQKQQRVQVVTTEDEGKVITFIADTTSGSTSKTLDIVLKNCAEEEIREILLGFENGLSEKNIDKFMHGEYNGEESAPLIGLKDAGYSQIDGQIEIKMVKNDMPEGKVPYWEEVSSTIEDVTGSEKMSGSLDTGLFSPMFNGISFTPVIMKENHAASFVSVSDEKGNVIQKDFGFTSLYESESGDRYEVKTETMSDGKQALAIYVTRDDCKEGSFAMRFADHLYKGLYSSGIDTDFDLSSTYKNEHCEVEKSDAGFVIRFFQA